MSFEEVSSSSFALDLINPFCLHASKSDQFCLSAGSLGILFELEYNQNNQDHIINFTLSYVNCPQNKITVSDEFKMKNIFNNATLEEKHNFFLNPQLVPKISSLTLKPSIVAIKWSPPNFMFSNKCLLAALNNYGEVEILVKRDDNRYWHPIIDVSSIIYKELKNKLLFTNNYKTYIKTIDDLTITAITWSTTINNLMYLLTIASSGILLIGSVEILNKEQIEYTIKENKIIDQNNVNILEWVLVKENTLAFLIAGDVNGNINLYKINLITEAPAISNGTTELWGDFDDIAVTQFIIERCKESDKFLIIVSKGSFILLFLITDNGKLLTTENYYIGNMFISALSKLNSMEYLVCAYTGFMALLKCSIIDTKIDFTFKNIDCNINFSQFALYGIVPSHNKTLWNFALYPKEQFDHLVLREPAKIIVCTFSQKYPETILENNITHDLSKYNDCCEFIRYLTSKNGTYKFDLENLLKDIDVTREYSYKLKIYLLFISGMRAFYKRKNYRLEQSNRIEFELIGNILESIVAYINLNALSEYKKLHTLSPEQKLTIKCLRVFLKNTLKLSSFDIYEKIIISLKVKYDKTINELNDINSDGCGVEKCVYCFKEIPENELVCPDKHIMDRCTITKTQLPLFERLQCLTCERSTLINFKEIFHNIKNAYDVCPTCDHIFVPINNIKTCHYY